MIIKMHHICIYYSFIITMDTIQIIFCYYIHSIRNSIYSVPMKKKVNTLMHIIVSLYDSIFHTHFAFVLFFFYKRWVWVMCHEMAAIILSLYTHLYLIGGGGVKKKVPGNPTKYLVYSNPTVNHSNNRSFKNEWKLPYMLSVHCGEVKNVFKKSFFTYVFYLLQSVFYGNSV